jgi:ring-1,2-phenylacetyl-CoA epoxidase subunit PaaD
MVTEASIWKLLEDVPDPEIPVLSVVDLGIVRAVQLNGKSVMVTVTPTYSGCPAVKAIENSIREKLIGNGIENPILITSLSPAWSTDWISENVREKLKAYGIAPPIEEVDKSVLFADPPKVPCPRCNSTNTRMISQFGSTACKSHYQCNDCLEPFDYFKCLK